MATLAIRVLMARALGVEALGALLLTIGLVSLVSSVSTFGTDRAAARRIAELGAAGRPARFAAVGVTALVVAGAGGLVATVGCLFAPGLQGLGLEAEMATAFRNLAPMCFGLALGMSMLGISRGHHDTRGRAFFRDALGAVLRLAAVGLAVGLSSRMSHVALAFGAAVATSELIFVAYGAGRGWLRGTWRVDRELLATLPSHAGLTLLNQVRSWFDLVLLGLVAPLPVVGLFGVARGVGRMLSMLREVAAHRFLPVATDAVTRHDRERLSSSFILSRRLMLTYLWPIVALALLCPGAVIDLLFGGRYAEAAPVLQVLGAGAFVEGFFGYADVSLIAKGRTSLLVRIDLVSVVVGAALIVGLASWLGALGAALAVVVSALLRVAWSSRAGETPETATGRLWDLRFFGWLALVCAPAVLAAAGAHAAGLGSLPRLVVVGLAAGLPAVFTVGPALLPSRAPTSAG